MLRLSLATYLIIWAIRNLYPIEPMEYRLVEQGILSWMSAPVFTRFFISCQFIVAGLLIFNINPGNRTVKAVILLLVTAPGDILWELIYPEKVILHCYGCLLDLTWVSVICWMLMAGLSIFLLRFNSTDFTLRWVKYTIMLGLLPWPFILNPVYPQDFRDNQAEVKKPLETEFLSDSIEPRTFLMVFFTPGCRHCQRVAKKISIAEKRSIHFPATIAVFPGEPEHVQYFMKRSNTNLNHVIIAAEEFARLSNGVYPTLLLVDDDNIKKIWNGRTFNYAVVNNLSKPNTSRSAEIL